MVEINMYYNVVGKETICYQYLPDASNKEQVMELIKQNEQGVKFYEPKSFINMYFKDRPEVYVILKPGDWIVKNYHHDYYPVKDELFKKSFKKIKEKN